MDNSVRLCSIGSMSEGKERIVAEHPKAWVVRMVEGRGLKVAEKTLYWWSVHLERFLKFCRSAGAESIEIPRGGGKVVFGVISSRRFGAGICAGAGADGFGCFYWGNGGVVVG